MHPFGRDGETQRGEARACGDEIGGWQHQMVECAAHGGVFCHGRGVPHDERAFKRLFGQQCSSMPCTLPALLYNPPP